MKIIKMDRRFTLYHQGFTHQIRSMNLRERYEVSTWLTEKYGAAYDYGDGLVKVHNRNWRLERPRRSYTGGTKIYVKHEQDLVFLGLKFGARIG